MPVPPDTRHRREAQLVRTWHLGSMFSSLQNRYFRWLWVGGLASSATYQMSTVAQGWLVYKLTGSAFALGWVSAGWSISTLILSLYGGVISDRVEKRRLLLLTRAAMAANSLVLAVVIAMGAVQIWHLAASGLLTGVLFAFMMPASTSVLMELVDREALLNANSMNSVGMGLMGIFSASLAGVLIETVGAQGVYYVMAALYLIAVLTLTRLPGGLVGTPSSGTIWRGLRDGIGYMLRSATVRSLLMLTLARVIFAMPYRTLMPKYATDVMGFDAAGLGTLMSAPGVGSLIASLAVASLGNFGGKAKMLLISGALMGGALVLFAQVPTVVVVLISLGLVGGLGQVCMITNQTLLQMNCEDCFKGRVMSMYMMMWGLTPLGTIPAGAIADALGVPIVIAVQGVLVVAIFGSILLIAPDVRRLD